jgi:hypothetical protein
MTAATGTRSSLMEARVDFLHTDKAKEIVPVSGAGTHMRAIATAVEHQRSGVAAD